MRALVDPYASVSVSVGVHPNEEHRREPQPDELVRLAADPHGEEQKGGQGKNSRS